MTRSLLIVGCGGHGRVVADAAIELGFERIAFLDDAASTAAPPPGTHVLGGVSMIAELVSDWPVAIAAIGSNEARLGLFDTLRQQGFQTPCIVHPSAILSRTAVLDDGVFIAAGAVIGVSTQIGAATIVNTGARIDHDCRVGQACHVAPGATLSGNVTVGERTWLGTGCSVRQGIAIGDGVMVGVGAAVVSDLQSAGTYVGVPARLRDGRIRG